MFYIIYLKQNIFIRINNNNVNNEHTDTNVLLYELAISYQYMSNRKPGSALKPIIFWLLIYRENAHELMYILQLLFVHIIYYRKGLSPILLQYILHEWS